MTFLHHCLQLISRSSQTFARSGAVAVLLAVGGCSLSHSTVDADGDGYTADVDCDDSNSEVYPGAPERCDGAVLDYNCDGEIPPCIGNPIWDADGDGYNELEDCDDLNPQVYPGAENLCEVDRSIDWDCDGETICTIDADGDGFTEDIDCDDDDPAIYPGAPEPCGTGTDWDCDGIALDCPTNDFRDADGDGYLEVIEDCDDNDPQIHPGATEPECPDGIDQNCDGQDGLDVAIACPLDGDGDGFDYTEDCNDRDATVYPGAFEGVCPDGIDQDCDGEDGYDDPLANCFGDADGDGFLVPEDCDDTRAFVHPGRIEDCTDRIDNDCDGIIDEVPPEGCFFGNGMLDADELEDGKASPEESPQPLLMSVDISTFA